MALLYGDGSGGRSVARNLAVLLLGVEDLNNAQQEF